MEIHGDDGDEEAQPQRLVKTPYTPSKAEMAEHRANGHIPYRSWCPDCVEGFGREWAHTGSGIDREFPLVSCDYLYITQSGVFLRTELGDEEREAALHVLVLFCGTSKSMFAHAVPRKGVDPKGYVTEQIR